MKYECYKQFAKRKAWLLILVFMGLRLLTVFLQPNYAADYRMELYRDAYMKHMTVLEGRLNDEKAAYITETNSLIRELTAENRESFIRDYVNGAITEEEFNERYRLRNSGYRMRDEFAVINDRYQSVLQNPDRVYFLYTNGWAGLIGNEHPDFVLLILIMLLTVPMICEEYSSEMYPILRTTPNGGMRLYAVKCAVGILSAVLSVLLLFTVECLYYAASASLPDGSFPLQSIPAFSASPYQISIIGAAALTVMNRCCGAVFLTVLLMCISAVFRRALSAFFLGTVSVLLPFILFSDSAMKYLFPSPLGLLLSCGFLKGSSPVSPYSQETITITPPQYLTVMLISTGLTAVLFLIGMLAFSGFRIPRRRFGKATVLCLMLLLLTGCKKPAAEPDLSGLVYDQWSYRPESDAFSVVKDAEKGTCISFADSEKPEQIIRDCFQDPVQSGMACMSYIDGDILYYLNQYNLNHYDINALDTRDFSVRKVHETEWSDNTDRMDMLFGLGAYLPSERQQEEYVYSFFVCHDELYLLKSRGLFRYDLRTGAEVCIYEGKADNLAAACGSVYYLDEVLDLYRYNPKTNLSEKMPVGKTERFYAAADGLYCRDLREGKFFLVSPDGSRKEQMSEFDEDAFLKGEQI